MHEISLKNNERIALLRFVNEQLRKFNHYGATQKKLELFYSLQSKLKI